MIFNMVGGGGGSGATLVVSSPVNVSVTVSKDDKSYTKNSGSLGSTTFKGLATGTWTVTISGNGQTATKTIEITADYAITIAFFSATINITYPANSDCVVTNSSGQTVASDTNTGSSTKKWTATVNAKGTYTVTATATDGSGKSKSQSVSITADGQSKSVVLSYDLELYKNGSYIVPFTAYAGKCGSISNGTPTITDQSSHFVMTVPLNTAGSYVSDTAVNITDYNTLILEYEHQASDTNGSWDCVICLMNNPTDNWYSTYVMRKAIPLTSDKSVLTVDVSGITKGNYYVHLGIFGGRTLKVYNLRFEE